MTSRLRAYAAVALLAAPGVDLTLLLRSGDLVVGGVAAFAGVAVAGLVLESMTKPTLGWLPPRVEEPARSAADPGLAALRRLVTDHQTARTPDRRLQERLARLARARRSRPGDAALDDLLARLEADTRITPAELSRIIDRIEDL